MRQFPTFYKTHHLALALRMSAAGVRLRVRMGYMTPDAMTADGTALWSPDGVEREMWAEAALKRRALAAGIRNGDTRIFLQRRGPSRDPVQLEIEA